jgi:hypothetical protein
MGDWRAASELLLIMYVENLVAKLQGQASH